MQKRFLAAPTRVYTTMGSVFAKILAEQKQEFVIFSYHPPEKRIKAKKARLTEPTTEQGLKITTEIGTYEVSCRQRVRLANGRVIPVTELKVGDQIQACQLLNQSGNIMFPTSQGHRGLHEVVEADIYSESHDLSQATLPPLYQTVQSVEEIQELPVYELHIDCHTDKAPLPDSGHNLLVWSDGTSFGSGIFMM